MVKLKLSRTVTKSECEWLDKDFQEDEEVFQYHGYTYGCISGKGVACTLENNKTPFFELPIEALERID
jgi:hypothetical protein